MKRLRTATPSTFSRIDHKELAYLMRGETFALKQQGGKSAVSLGGKYQPCVCYPPPGLRPMAPVGEIGASNDPPDLPFPETMRYDAEECAQGCTGKYMCECERCRDCEPEPPRPVVAALVVCSLCSMIFSGVVIGILCLIWSGR